MSTLDIKQRRKIMGYCKDCEYSQKGEGLWPDLFCQLMSDSRGYLRKVEPKGSCSHFSARMDYNNSGYSSGSSGCFLTSACVEYLGKDDDCAELTALRKFRDSYMKSTEEGKKLVEEYYSVAPKIVESINASGKKDEYYKYINKVVDSCVKLIDLKEYERVLNEYKFMVLNLKKEFSL